MGACIAKSIVPHCIMYHVQIIKTRCTCVLSNLHHIVLENNYGEGISLFNVLHCVEFTYTTMYVVVCSA